MSEGKKRMSIYLPQFTIGEDAFDAFSDEMLRYGSKAAVIYGEKAWNASKEYIVPALEKAGIELTCQQLYGHDATFENVEKIAESPEVLAADFLIGAGGGKCIDTVKLAADRLGKPVFTIPTIASNCAPVTKISIMYHEDGSFREIPRLKTVPAHCFINPKIILAAPVRYLWAGIGDAMAKNVESEWSAKAGERLKYGSELGITAGYLCFGPMLRDAQKALADAAAGQNSEELEEVILNVVVTPGITSVSVDLEYNGGVAHALFYGLTSRKHIEQGHLHGEVVSYGTLVNLMLDGGGDKFKQAYEFNRSIGLPVRLSDLELEESDPLEDVLEVTLANQELKHTPYPVSRETVYGAIRDLEQYPG